MTVNWEHPDPSGAVLSDDGLYRYRLWRRGEGELSYGDRHGPVCFVMLNPSTADHTTDDPTVRRCLGFTKRWGYGGIEVVNLFAWRSTDPKALKNLADPIGPENDGHIAAAVRASDLVVLAYGTSPMSSLCNRQARVWDLLFGLSGRPEVVCLEILSTGYRHPLYARYDHPIEPLLGPLRPVSIR